MDDFDLETLAYAILPGSVEMEIEDQSGGLHTRSLTGFDSTKPVYRLGPATITLENSQADAFGGCQSWVTVNARIKQLDFIINWNDGTLPASPDVYFRSVRLNVPPGWTWTSFLPDPAVGSGYLVKPDNHVLPQRMERSFRVIVHPIGTAPDLDYRGWGTTSWAAGGYFCQSIPLPDLSFANVDLSVQKDDDYDRLLKNLPTIPGDTPVNFLWPARGVKYGGMTGGIDVLQFEGIVPAVTAQTDGILSLYVEQLRYGARQMGCIYESDGSPIAIEAYANPDGSLPWSMFNNVFLGNPPKDMPFGFSQTGPGVGFSGYDPLDYQPIDDQHLIRRSKANKALAWLDNDPLARLYIDMDATLKRMSYYEGTGGRIQIPPSRGQGVTWGRAEAWAADVLATSYALGDDAWRARHLAWFTQFALSLNQAEMTSGLFSALTSGKVATALPYGHHLNQPCPWGIHTLQPTSNTEVADFLAHRGNEQTFLILALRGIKETVGIDTGDLIRKAGEGLWNLAWKPGTDGVLDRYPVGFVNGQPFTTSSQIPAGLTATVPKDSYHVGTALYNALVEGGALLPALYAYTSSSDLLSALAALENRGVSYVENYAPLLAVLQQIAP